MRIEEVCKSRKIPNTSIETPLLIPAFSSATYGIVDNTKMDLIGKIYMFLKEKIKKASLFSAYDLFNGFINKNEIHHPDIVFIDSGIYEFDCYNKTGKKVEWSYQKYLETLDSIKPSKSCVLINFDKKTNIKSQILEANNFFNRYPSCIKDFLYKPNQADQFVDMDELIENIDELKKFDIIGITEKELGHSPLKRCENLLKLRLSLNSVNLPIPIHIFGCLDFLSILSFYFCGADIFDGLSWLRYGYYKNISIHVNNYALIEGFWEENISNIYDLTYIRNLSQLIDFMEMMKTFSYTYNYNVFNMKEKILNQLKLLINNAGIDVMV